MHVALNEFVDLQFNEESNLKTEDNDVFFPSTIVITPYQVFNKEVIICSKNVCIFVRCI